MTEPYSKRPNDDLVEPLFAGIQDADEASVPQPPAGRSRVALVLFALALALVGLWLVA